MITDLFVIPAINLSEINKCRCWYYWAFLYATTQNPLLATERFAVWIDQLHEDFK